MDKGIQFYMEIGRSKWFLYYIVAVHSVMLITLFCLPINMSLLVLGAVSLQISFVYFCSQNQWLINKAAINKIERNETGLWSITFQNDEKQVGLKLINSFVTTNLIIMSLKNDSWWSRLPIVIFADAVDKNIFRQLRVYLRDPKTFLK